MYRVFSAYVHLNSINKNSRCCRGYQYLRPWAKADYLSVCVPPPQNWVIFLLFDRLKYLDFRSKKLPKIPLAILGEFLNQENLLLSLNSIILIGLSNVSQVCLIFKLCIQSLLVICFIVKWTGWSIIKGLQISRGKNCLYQPTRFYASGRRSTEKFPKSLKLQFAVTHDSNQSTHRHSIDDDYWMEPLTEWISHYTLHSSTPLIQWFTKPGVDVRKPGEVLSELYFFP